MDLFDRIDKALDEKGMSRRQLAKISGVSAGSLGSMYHRRVFAGVEMLGAICTALNVSADYLIFGDDSYKYVRDPTVRGLIKMVNATGNSPEKKNRLIGYIEALEGESK